jgi:putative ABC transport system permease protein
MRISTIAWANLKRRKGKAAFLAIGIAIGIGTAVALMSLSSSIKEEIGSQLDQFGANIVVAPQSNSLDYGGVFSLSLDDQQLKEEDASQILNIPYRNRLSVIAPKLLGRVRVEGREALLAGVDFKSELALNRWWRIVGRAPDTDQELILGYEVARVLSLVEPLAPVAEMQDDTEHANHEAGEHPPFEILRDRINIDGREHRVAGVLFETGRQEDRMIFGSLAYVQGLLGKPSSLSLIEVSALCKDCPVEDIVAQINEQLPHARVSAIQQSVRARAETVDRLTRFFAIVSGIVLAVGALMIFTTMMGAVIERTKEIGVLRAIGFRKAHIVKELMLEVAVISTLGGLAGWAAGTAASFAALPYFAETDVRVHIEPSIALAAVLAGLAVGMLSSLYPIIRASKLDPSEAVRYV